MDPKKLAHEISMVLKYNPDLSEADRETMLFIRLEQYATYIRENTLNQGIPTSDYSNILPEEFVAKTLKN